MATINEKIDVLKKLQEDLLRESLGVKTEIKGLDEQIEFWKKFPDECYYHLMYDLGEKELFTGDSYMVDRFGNFRGDCIKCGNFSPLLGKPTKRDYIAYLIDIIEGEIVDAGSEMNWSGLNKVQVMGI